MIDLLNYKFGAHITWHSTRVSPAKFIFTGHLSSRNVWIQLYSNNGWLEGALVVNVAEKKRALRNKGKLALLLYFGYAHKENKARTLACYPS